MTNAQPKFHIWKLKPRHRKPCVPSTLGPLNSTGYFCSEWWFFTFSTFLKTQHTGSMTASLKPVQMLEQLRVGLWAQSLLCRSAGVVLVQIPTLDQKVTSFRHPQAECPLAHSPPFTRCSPASVGSQPGNTAESGRTELSFPVTFPPRGWNHIREKKDSQFIKVLFSAFLLSFPKTVISDILTARP